MGDDGIGFEVQGEKHMEEIEKILERMGHALSKRDKSICDWKIVYDVFGREHKANRCKECIGKGHVRDTYCSSYTQNGHE